MALFKVKVEIKVENWVDNLESEIIEKKIIGNFKIVKTKKSNFFISDEIQAEDKQIAKNTFDDRVQTILNVLSLQNRCNCELVHGTYNFYRIDNGISKKPISIMQGTKFSAEIQYRLVMTSKEINKQINKVAEIMSAVDDKYPELKMALAFYRSHFAQNSPETSYLFLWQSLEILTEAKQINWSSCTLKMIDNFIKEVNENLSNNEEKKFIESSLTRIKKKSIRKALKILCDEVSPENQELTNSIIEKGDGHYDFRSNLVHPSSKKDRATIRALIPKKLIDLQSKVEQVLDWYIQQKILQK